MPQVYFLTTVDLVPGRWYSNSILWRDCYLYLGKLDSGYCFIHTYGIRTIESLTKLNINGWDMVRVFKKLPKLQYQSGITENMITVLNYVLRLQHDINYFAQPNLIGGINPDKSDVMFLLTSQRSKNEL